MKGLKTLALIAMGLVAGVGIGRVKHYQTKYQEDGQLKVESWIQFELFNQVYCFSRRVTEIN